jgi:hypothetical protein
MTPIKFNAPWHSLKHVCVGQSYCREFYEPIKNSKVRESLQKIAVETEEDYTNLIKVLKSFDIKVSRPAIDENLTIVDFIDGSGRINYESAQSFTLIPRPPMQPRDSFLIIGSKVLPTNHEFNSFKNSIFSNDLTSVIANDMIQQFDAPLATVIGDTIILDCQEHAWLYKYFSTQFNEYKIKPVYIGGHNDAVYSVIKPGVLISTYHYDNYKETFPGWSVKYIKNQSWNAIPGWRKIKHSNVNKWWAPDSLVNSEFSNFINTWLDHWLGYVTETVFDVNLLQIDTDVVLVNNYNKEMFDFLKKHKVEPIICPFRHRFFWDGGIHCITNDLYREGEKESYV